MDDSGFNSKSVGAQSYTNVLETDNKPAVKNIDAPKLKNGRQVSLIKTIKSLFNSNGKKSTEKWEQTTNLSDRKIKLSKPLANLGIRSSLKPFSLGAPNADLSAVNVEARGGEALALEVDAEVMIGAVSSLAGSALEAAAGESVAIDVGVGVISHSVTLGLKMHKLSKLIHRKIAFDACPTLVKKWESLSTMRGQKMSGQDMKDYAKIAKLSADDITSVSKQDPLRMVLGENKCHYANDQQILRLTNSLLQLTEKQGRLTQDVHKRLDEWQKKFKDRAEKFDERIKNGKTSKEDGLLKAGHQSKMMMKAFNDIVKTMGVKIDYSTPVKQGKSALASRHKFVIDDKKLHSFLKKSAQLPEKKDIKNLIVSYKEDAEILKAFSGYEARKIRHQSNQVGWTAGVLLASVVPVVQLDKAVRSGRGFSEHRYREKNNQILDFKLEKIADLQKKLRIENQSSELIKVLELAKKVVKAKKDRTKIKSDTAVAHGSIDAIGALAGSAAAIFAPGVGSVVTNVLIGTARGGATLAGSINRYITDKVNQQFGRIETKVYIELKKAYMSVPDDKSGDSQREAFRNAACQLFDISDKQAGLLFAQDLTQDLVSGKGIIRLRFNNFKIKDIPVNKTPDIDSTQSGEFPPPPKEWLDDINSMSSPLKAPEKDAPPPEK